MKFRLLIAFMLISALTSAQLRKTVSLNTGWRTVADDTNPEAYPDFEKPNFNDNDWQQVNVPHNHDNYEGFRQLRHGNRHGYAWYRNTFNIEPRDKQRRVFLYFEGVGSYATVYVNGRKVAYHAGGRTTFTVDATNFIELGKNTIAVRADHPSMISDLPWVCGGCSGEWGFSEGSQPMGIFRPVSMIITNETRIEPFGVHAWNNNDISADSAALNIRTEVKNYNDKRQKTVELLSKLVDDKGTTVASVRTRQVLEPGETVTIPQELKNIKNPKLWSVENPYLYTLVSEIYEFGKLTDVVKTPYGIRWVSWHLNRNDGSNQFYLNGKPVQINGTCEYEHIMGNSHAFADGQIRARVSQMRAAGFNAFRDAHQPHNLLYGQLWDSTGTLWWSQMSAHIWYDTREFRENFKQLLRDYIKERRNSPSIIMWGLQNESTLPTEFAQECTEIFREMDPTTSSQRLVTTCNGGTGTDWNVAQNWSGTYGGDPYNYENEISTQLLNGEYGAWRSIDWHTEGGYEQDGSLSEDRMTLLMEMKLRQTDAVKDKIAGQFHWLFNSHENPGRIQNGEGFRDIDKVGPVNYKGIVTPWAEPLDAYYMFRSNYAPKAAEPMVYIVSHTWPDRWTESGVKNGIRVFSNCDEVELFNDAEGASLGRRKREGGVGTHFIFNDVKVNYNILRAVGYVGGKAVAEDLVVLNHLPQSPNFSKLLSAENIATPKSGKSYIYRINCGGDNYTDANGQLWQADRRRTDNATWGSRSWVDAFPGIPPYFGSQRRTHDPLKGSSDWGLFGTFRYGTDELEWQFPLPDGEYGVELYFVEPWYGTGGGLDCKGWRMFDVAVGDDTAVKNLDIWAEAGHDRVLKKEVKGKAKNGILKISFPRTISGQAIISAIAIYSDAAGVVAAQPSPSLIADVKGSGWSKRGWLDTGVDMFDGENSKISYLPSYLHAAEWLGTSLSNNAKPVVELSDSTDVYIAVAGTLPRWAKDFRVTPDSVVVGGKDIYKVYSKRAARGKLELGSFADGGAYFAVLCYIANMGEEPSERPVVKLEAETAEITGSVERGNFKKSDFVKFADEGGNTIEWEVNPGLAATYLMRFRYMNRLATPITVQLEFYNANNGVMMRSERIDFPPADDKWRIISTTTGSMVNAGLYKIRLKTLGVAGLELESMEFE